MRNYTEYLKKYPWLRGNDLEDYEWPSTCALNWLPEGWVEAFGEEMCQELDIALRKTEEYAEAYVAEAKEKFGELRMWLHPHNDEIERIVMKYAEISRHTCLYCGKIDIPMLNIGGWWSPYCRHCYDKINRDGRHKPYDDVVDGDAEMPSVIKWGRFSKGGHEDFEMDVGETVEKIRERYGARVANGEVDTMRKGHGE